MEQSIDRRVPPHTIPEALSRYAHSEAPALLCGGEAVSWRALLRDAAHIARVLRARGVEKGDRVALDMSRGADYVRVCLGVIFAGAIQVTLHGGWPEQMRACVLSDCAPALRVTDGLARELLCAQAEELPLPALEGGDPFQIVYTSGSTGRPKGTVNCHQMVVDSYCAGGRPGEGVWLVEYFAQHCHRALVNGALAFALATAQLFLPLLNGRCAVMATEEETQTPGALAACIRRNGVDTVQSILTLVYQFIRDPDFAAALRPLRLLSLGGERADSAQLDAILRTTDAAMNWGYGTSEVMSVLSAEYHAGDEILFTEPAHGFSVHLLEENGLAQAPPGTVGEVCVGGSAGRYGRYWSDAALTAEKYIDHPRWGRLLRTGDCARREPDGRLRILGRLDSMIKLNGLRIEPGSIESAMESFPGVQRAAVAPRREGGTVWLCGYYQGRVEQGALRRALAQTLPYYMVPAHLQELEALPLTATGKLDRRALPPIERPARRYVPPQTERETLLCRAFAQVLQADAPVGVEDSFFALGGDSLRAMAACALLREQGLELKTQWVFAAPTVRELAPMLRPLSAEDSSPEGWMELSEREWADIHRAVGRENVEAVYPVLFHAREYLRRNGLWMVSSLWTVDRRLSRGDIQAKLDELQRNHTALRSVFVGAGTDRPLQVVLRQARLSCFENDLSALAGADGELSERQLAYLRTLLRLTQQQNPDPAREVLFRLGLIHVSAHRTVVFCGYSHLLLDGVGIAQVAEELLGGAAVVQDAARFALQVRRLCTAQRTDALAHWRRMSGGAERFTALPPGAGRDVFVLDCVRSGAAALGRARSLCRARNITLSALFHLAAGEALMELLELPQVSFASTTSGRDAACAGLVGMFIHHFPLLVQRGDTPELIQDRLLSGLGHAALDTEELPPALSLPGMTGALKLNVQSAFGGGTHFRPCLIPGDAAFLAAQAAAAAPPAGIDGELTLMIQVDTQISLNFLYSPAKIDRAFVKRFAAVLLRRIRRLAEEGGGPE